MPSYRVDSTWFHAEGAVVNWDAVARRLGIPASHGRRYGSALDLRWMLNATMGMPTEPFRDLVPSAYRGRRDCST